MKVNPVIERLIYVLLVILALAALWLMSNVTSNFLNARVVYQGF